MIKSIKGVKVEVANSFTPTEQEWLWAVEDTDYNYKRMHYTFSVLWEVYDRFNVRYWVPDMDTLRIELATNISVKKLGSERKDIITIDGVEHKGVNNASKALIGWIHPNRTNIFNQYHVVEEFDWDKLRLVEYINKGNETKLPVFEYKGGRYQSVKTLSETFDLEPDEVKKKMKVKERDSWIVEYLHIKKSANTKAVYIARYTNEVNAGKLFKTVTELRKALQREGFKTSYPVAKTIFHNVIKGTYKYD